MKTKRAIITLLTLTILVIILKNIFEHCYIPLYTNEIKYITVTFSGRMGNHLFQYASLLSLARKNNKTAIIDIRQEFLLNDYFTLSVQPMQHEYRYFVVRYYMVYN